MTDDVTDELHLARTGEIATLTIDRPAKRNAISFEMYQRLPDLVQQVDEDPAVKVLIVRGAGQKSFSAGADISEFRSLRADSTGARVYNWAVHEAEDALAGTDKPTIAMVHGHCIGGGCGLALCCDFRLSGESGRFGITPAKLGLVYSLESSKRLVDLVGPSHARYILLSGRQIPAARADQIGLTTTVVPDHDLADEVQDLAGDLASRAQYTVRSMNQIIRRITEGQAFDDEETRALRDGSFDTDDYHEGVNAFLEKRPPQFTYS